MIVSIGKKEKLLVRCESVNAYSIVYVDEFGRITSRDAVRKDGRG
jgi:hypothetical protein